MLWIQPINPLNNLILSAIVAIIPVLYIFWSLIIKKMKGHLAILSAMVVAILVAIIAYKMPIELALLSTAYGALYGLFPICWIVIGAIFIFNITLKSGQFEIIKHFMSSISTDRRIQALLIAYSFGAFLEGTAGFGAPVAITATMLIGLGFNPLYAAGICLVANTAPVAFGSIGIPITVASQVSGIPKLAISQMVGRILPVLSLILPFYLVVLMSGLKRSIEVLPAILVSGCSFAFFQWFASNYLGPMLPDVIAGILSMICLMVFLKFWKPRNAWNFESELPPTINTEGAYSGAQVIKAWSPFIILTLMILAWGLQPVKEVLNHIGLMKFNFPGLNDKIQFGYNNKPLPEIFTFNYLSAAGTAIVISGFLSIPLVGMKWSTGFKVFFLTLNQLKFPILTIVSVLGFAYIVNNSGMSLTIAKALSNTGVLFPFFAPILGWIGVFITGSDTSSNALFSKLQYATAKSIGIDPVLTVAANSAGGVMGKMISPQSIAVAAAAGNLVGEESKLFRFTVKHSFIMLLIVCVITIIEAYIIPWVIPPYTSIKEEIISSEPSLSKGYIYISVLIISIILIFLTVLILNRKKVEVQE
jgi:lactate permease